MIPPEVIQLVSQVGQWVVFLYLYLQERQRNAELQGERFKDHKIFEDTLIRLITRDTEGDTERIYKAPNIDS